jgi:lactoylglutathione lyase
MRAGGTRSRLRADRDKADKVECRRFQEGAGRCVICTPCFVCATLTYNWDQSEPYSNGRLFGHLAFEVDDIYATCASLRARGVAILRPPRDGRMAFIKSPDGHSVEFLQKGAALEKGEPWASMGNEGEW